MNAFLHMFSGGNVFKMYFAFGGRLPRAIFWFRVGLLMIVLNLGASGIFFLMEGRPGMNSSSLWLTLLGGSWVSLSTLWMRRLQDRGVHGAWYGIVALGAPVALAFRMRVVEWMNAGNPMGESMNMPSILFGMAIFVVSCAFLMLFGFTRGTKGANAFGPDPLAPEVEKAAEERKGKHKKSHH